MKDLFVLLQNEISEAKHNIKEDIGADEYLQDTFESCDSYLTKSYAALSNLIQVLEENSFDTMKLIIFLAKLKSVEQRIDESQAVAELMAKVMLATGVQEKVNK